jgi:hypothetical protein
MLLRIYARDVMRVVLCTDPDMNIVNHFQVIFKLISALRDSNSLCSDVGLESVTV